ncbi:MAG TPA: T9SS type A sorting domain-containing protein, partial [Saprospiraceae bacterium]|nr:T9SS type A sorting domain-containing protein [Saprospiraceae bacterium]
IQLDSVFRPGVHFICGDSPNGGYGTYQIDTQFIACRKITETDTHYVFLKISTLYINMTIHQIISECPDFPFVFPTAIAPVSADKVVFVSPNPFSDQLIIQVPDEQECTFRLLDVTGKIILEKRIQQPSTLFTSFLSEGIYFYQILYPNSKTFVGKLLKS